MRARVGLRVSSLLVVLALPAASALGPSRARAQETGRDAPDLDRDGIPDVLEGAEDDDDRPPPEVVADPDAGLVRRGIRRRGTRYEPTATAEQTDTRSIEVEDELDRRSRERQEPRGLRADRPMLRPPSLPRIVHGASLQNEIGFGAGIGAFDVGAETRLALPLSATVEVGALDGRAYFGVHWAAGAAEASSEELRFAPGGVQAWGRFVARVSPRLAVGAGGGVGAPVSDGGDELDLAASQRAGFTHLPDRLLLERDLIAGRAFFDLAFRSGIVYLQARAGLDLWIPIGDRDELEVGIRGLGAFGLLPSDVVQGGLELALLATPTVSATAPGSRADKTDFRLSLFGELGGRQARVGLDAWIGLDRWGDSELSLGATLRVYMLF